MDSVKYQAIQWRSKTSYSDRRKCWSSRCFPVGVESKNRKLVFYECVFLLLEFFMFVLLLFFLILVVSQLCPRIFSVARPQDEVPGTFPGAGQGQGPKPVHLPLQGPGPNTYFVRLILLLRRRFPMLIFLGRAIPRTGTEHFPGPGTHTEFFPV